MDLTTLTGLELVQAIIEGKIPHPPMFETIPMRLLEAANGYVKLRAQADGRHLSPFGSVHGGFVTTVLDTVVGLAVQTALEQGVGHATVDVNSKMLKFIPLDQELIAEGRLLHRSRTLAVSEGSIRNRDGLLLAHGTATAAILQKREP